MKLTDKEIEPVIRLDSEKRFEYAIKRIADNERLYSVKLPDGLCDNSLQQYISFPGLVGLSILRKVY